MGSGSYKDWHIPLSEEGMTLEQAFANIQAMGLKQEQIPFLIQLVENPDFDLPGFDLFHGATSLKTHDLLHVILGRGLLAKDEAFVIGFTMGSSNRVSGLEEKLYSLITKYLYPRQYRFSDSDLAVYKDAVRLGFISDCTPLSEVDFEPLMPLTLKEVRRTLGIEDALLSAYFQIEKNRYPDAQECQRLLD